MSLCDMQIIFVIFVVEIYRAFIIESNQLQDLMKSSLVWNCTWLKIGKRFAKLVNADADTPTPLSDAISRIRIRR